LDGNFKRIVFNDEEYKHRYEINNHQGVNKNHDLWTGTSYQVNLDYRKDYVTS